MADKPLPSKKPAAVGVQISTRLKGLIRKNETMLPPVETRAAPTAAVTTSRPTEELPVQKRGLFGALVSTSTQKPVATTEQPVLTTETQPKIIEKPVTVLTTAAEDIMPSKPRKGPPPPPSIKSIEAAAAAPESKSRKGPPPPLSLKAIKAAETKYNPALCVTKTGEPALTPPELKPYSAAYRKSLKKTHYKIKDEELKPFKVSNRFSFSHFIPTMYSKFKIKGIPKSDPDACKKMTFQENKYQQFIREYFRLDSPTRGALVYHGLGSGKTCSAIAAAEALFSQSGRKIIVMTPVSLRANFIREIKFCGFKIYRTQNHWTPLSLYKDEDEEEFDWGVYCFAKSVLHLSSAYIQTIKSSATAKKVIWVPDMREGKEPNFDTKTPAEKRQITAQIDAMINNSITFIGYNGLTEKKLKHYAMNEPDFFNNKTIIIDEVHNLTSLMRNRLTKYLEKPVTKPGRTSKKAPSVFYDPLRVEPWRLVEGKERKYDRAYLIYRLLSEARHSKIIALSGTPVVNYPEELGILGNLLHGNFHCASFKVDHMPPIEEDGKIISDQKTLIDRVLEKEPYVDFYNVTSAGTYNNIFITRIEPGFRKAFSADGKYEGVVYEGDMVPNPEYTPEAAAADPNIKEFIPTPGIKEVAQKIRSVLPINGEITYSALPLFPVSKAKFNDMFVDTAKIRMKNSLVFLKRMSGLISYYKGGRKDYMPSINKDVIIHVPMSGHMLGSYIEARRKEREADESMKKMKKKETEAAATGFTQTISSSSVNWGTITGIPNDSQGKDTASSSYRFRSRALCNFAFPRNIPRPFPRDSTEAEAAAGLDVPVYGDEDDTVEEEKPAGATEAVEAAEENESADMAEAVREDNEAVAEVIAEETSEDPAVEKVRTEAEATFQAAKKDDGIMGEMNEDERALYSGVSYEERIARTIEKLRARMNELFLMDETVAETSQLAYYSPKFAAIYTNIEAAPGSSLVYSQFKTLEGLGIFSIALEANGYARVRLVRKEGGKVGFAPETMESINENPTQRRYTIFSGDPQDAEFRKELVDIFNMNIEDPTYSEIRQLLVEKGIYDPVRKVGNQAGEFCRIFMITGAGSEGISLKNVRAVHLMEPHWNKVRMDQVKGRAVRICSHKDLPLKDRNVDIYTYLSVLTEEQLRKNQEIMIQDDGKTSDEFIYNVAHRKNRLNNDFLETLHMGAVDCELNKIENGMYRCFERDATKDNFLYDPRIELDTAYTQLYFNRNTEIQRRVIKPVPEGVLEELDMDSDVVAYANERMKGVLGEDYRLIYTEMIDGAGETYFGVFSDDELTHPIPFDRDRELGRLALDEEEDIIGIQLQERPETDTIEDSTVVIPETQMEEPIPIMEDEGDAEMPILEEVIEEEDGAEAA